MWVMRVFILPVSRDTREPGSGDGVWRRLVHFCEWFWPVFPFTDGRLCWRVGGGDDRRAGREEESRAFCGLACGGFYSMMS